MVGCLWKLVVLQAAASSSAAGTAESRARRSGRKRVFINL
jgi:hypothetical protein